MKRSKETFRFTPELGARLRGLRLAAGVTQQELAVLMGRQGKGCPFLVSRLETGRVRYPSLGFVADYLRACRASFADLADLLEAYTSLPTTLEQRGYRRVRSLADKLPPEVWDAVRRYDSGVSRSRLKPETAAERLKRAVGYARSQAAQHRLGELVAGELAKAGIDSASPVAFRLRLYARKLWGVLNQARAGHKHKLKRKLEELNRWTAESGLASLPAFASLTGRVTELARGEEPGPESSKGDI
jgi:transcriptional regulator with XRE-family HTH domain